MAQPTTPAIGIDLGTTYSCVAVYKDGKVEIIQNEQGERITPSYVGFNEEERLIGETALNEVGMNPENTVFDSKRLIGRSFDDVTEEEKKHWPFEVVNDNGKPKLQVKFKGETKTFHPEEISAMVLMKLKETAEAYLGKTVRDAVITVPAYFNDAQRRATKVAGEIAGINVLRLINEPTAAAIAYWHGKKVDNRTILVFDLGGVKFDVSVVQIEQGAFQVKAVSGDSRLGGHDFDNRLVEYLVEYFKLDQQDGLRTNKKAMSQMSRLRVKCEQAKRVLSLNNQASMEIDSPSSVNVLRTVVTKQHFEDINKGLFDRLIDRVKVVLKESNMEEKIDEVVLVGGSTRIPKVQQDLKEFFEGKELNKSMNADEAVGYGAAVMAAQISGELKGKKLTVQDVSTSSLSAGDDKIRVIERNKPIPKTRYLDLTEGGKAIFQVYESDYFSNERILGFFQVTNIPPAGGGVTFHIDPDGILTVRAVQTGSDSENMTATDHSTGRFSKGQIEQMVANAHAIKEDEENYRQKTEEENDLEEYAYKLKSAAQRAEGRGNVSKDEIDATLCKCDQVLKWLKDNKNPEPSEVQVHIKELGKMWKSVNSKVHLNEVYSYLRKVIPVLTNDNTRTAAALDKCNHVLQWLELNKDTSALLWDDLKMMNSVPRESPGQQESQNQVKEQPIPEQTSASLLQIYAVLNHWEEVVKRSELIKDKEAENYQHNGQGQNEMEEVKSAANVLGTVPQDEKDATLEKCIRALEKIKQNMIEDPSAVQIRQNDLENLLKHIESIGDKKVPKKQKTKVKSKMHTLVSFGQSSKQGRSSRESSKL